MLDYIIFMTSKLPLLQRFFFLIPLWLIWGGTFGGGGYSYRQNKRINKGSKDEQEVFWMPWLHFGTLMFCYLMLLNQPREVRGRGGNGVSHTSTQWLFTAVWVNEEVISDLIGHSKAKGSSFWYFLVCLYVETWHEFLDVSNSEYLVSLRKLRFFLVP